MGAIRGFWVLAGNTAKPVTSRLLMENFKKAAKVGKQKAPTQTLATGTARRRRKLVLEAFPFSHDSAAVRYQSRVGCTAGLTIPRALTLPDHNVMLVLTDLALRCLPRFVTDGGVELAMRMGSSRVTTPRR